MLSNWIISFSASLLPSLRPQYGCTALQTAPGKRPQVALCVYISMLNKHVTPPPPSLFLITLQLSVDICFARAVIFLSFHPSAQTLQSVHPSLQTWWATGPEHGPYGSACDWNEVSSLILYIWLQHGCRSLPVTSFSFGCTVWEWWVESEEMELKLSLLQVNIREKEHFSPPPADINTHCDTNAITDFPHLANILADI